MIMIMIISSTNALDLKINLIYANFRFYFINIQRILTNII